MKLATLEIFVDVVRCGGFAPAAHKRGQDASVVSRAVAGLERELGVTLFERTTRRFRTTEAGRVYFAEIEPLLGELTAAGSRARDVATEPSGELRVTCSVAFGVEVIVPLLGALRRRYPSLDLNLHLADDQVALDDERFDAAIRLGPAPAGELVRTRLMPVRHRVCAAPAYLAQHRPIAAPDELSGHQCVCFPYDGFRRRWRFRDKVGNDATVAIAGGLVISNALALKRCILDGLGPGLLADWMTAQEIADGRLVDLFPAHAVTATTFETAAWILYPSRAYVPLKLRVFIDFLREQLARGENA